MILASRFSRLFVSLFKVRREISKSRERIATKRHRKHKKDFLSYPVCECVCIFVAILSYPELALFSQT